MPASTSSRSKLESVLSVLLTGATVVLAASIAVQTWNGNGDADRAGTPAFVDGWEVPDSVASRTNSQIRGVELVVISDPQCPVCRTFNKMLASMDPALRDRLSITHVLVALDYHEFAIPAIRASECAQEQGAFEGWMTAVYAKQDSLGSKAWESYALDAGVRDVSLVASCARSTDKSARMLAAEQYADRVGIRGTPTVLLNGWRLPNPPTKALLTELVAAIERGEHPFRTRRWRALVASTRSG